MHCGRNQLFEFAGERKEGSIAVDIAKAVVRRRRLSPRATFILTSALATLVAWIAAVGRVPLGCLPASGLRGDELRTTAWQARLSYLRHSMRQRLARGRGEWGRLVARGRRIWTGGEGPRTPSFLLPEVCCIASMRAERLTGDAAATGAGLGGCGWSLGALCGWGAEGCAASVGGACCS